MSQWILISQPVQYTTKMVETHSTHSESASAYEEISLPTNSDCSTMAQKKLVYGILQVLIDFPMRLPIQQNLLSQLGIRIDRPNPQVFSLVAWLLSTDHLKVKAFQNNPENYWQHPGDRYP